MSPAASQQHSFPSEQRRSHLRSAFFALASPQLGKSHRTSAPAASSGRPSSSSSSCLAFASRRTVLSFVWGGGSSSHASSSSSATRRTSFERRPSGGSGGGFRSRFPLCRMWGILSGMQIMTGAASSGNNSNSSVKVESSMMSSAASCPGGASMRSSSRIVDRDDDNDVDVRGGDSTCSSETSAASQHQTEAASSRVLAAVRKELASREGLTLDDFDVHATVGTGSFGRVCVVDLRDAPSWYPAMALKILSKQKVIQTRQVDHVKDEKRILSELDHPFIIHLLASFQDERRLFLLMEYVNGGELFSYIRRQAYMPTEHARVYAAEITLALEYLHTRQIVYRDLKPENLLFDAQGHIKITDFGFAKVVVGRTWTLCGTHEYLAPELITRRGHGLQVDWWALGVLLFEMLAGHPPFVDETPLGIYRKIIAGKIQFPPAFDYAAKSLVKRLLTHEPSRRFGCLRDGAEDVKSHRFFRSIDWTLCYQKKLKVPYKPNTHGPRDWSLFDKYPESTESSAPVIEAPEEQALFVNF